MIKYAQIANEKTKQVNVGLGTATEFYKSIGMIEMDVEKCDWNGNWYITGYAPKKPSPTKEEQIVSLKAQLSEIDAKSARSMRAILAETATQEDRDFLAQLESEAEEIRQELQLLNPVTGD